MLTPSAALKSAFRKYAEFSGRAPRSEYWWFQLLVAIVWIVMDSLLTITAGTSNTPNLALLSVFGLMLLGLFLPNLSVLVRRLHDTNRSGLFVLIGLVPFLGGIVLFVFALLPSDDAGSRFDKADATTATVPAPEVPQPVS